MLSPRGGSRAYVEHLASIAFPTLANLTKNLGPRVGMFVIFARRNNQVTSSHVPVCVQHGYKSPERWLFLVEVSTCFYIYTKTLLLTTRVQY